MMKIIQNANNLINKLYSVSNITRKLCNWHLNFTKDRGSFDDNRKMGFHCNTNLEDDLEQNCTIRLLQKVPQSTLLKYDFTKISKIQFWGGVIIFFIAIIFLRACCCRRGCNSPSQNSKFLKFFWIYIQLTFYISLRTLMIKKILHMTTELNPTSHKPWWELYLPKY